MVVKSSPASTQPHCLNNFNNNIVDLSVGERITNHSIYTKLCLYNHLIHLAGSFEITFTEITDLEDELKIKLNPA